MTSGTDSRDDRPAVMRLGNANRAEMQRVMDWLNNRVFPFSRQIHAPDICQAINEAAGHLFFPDLIVVLQSWSDEYSRDEIDNLLAFTPLARIVVCYGAWCESDGRNHNLWPPSVRVPLWAAEARIEREWRLIQNPGNTHPLPWSASRDEAFAADHPAIAKFDHSRTFLVDTPDPAIRQSVTEIMQEAGHKLVEDLPYVLLIDVDPWNSLRAQAVQRRAEQYPGAARVAITSLALPSMEAELRSIGITMISRKLGFRPPTRELLNPDPDTPDRGEGRSLPGN